ncbi:hypothetical protein [Hymenobacter sp. B81]
MTHPTAPRYVSLEKKLRLTNVLLRVWLTAGAAATAASALLL